MNNPALIVFLAAVLVLVMMALPVGVAILMRRGTRTEMHALEGRMSERIDSLSTKVGALTRKAEEAIQIGNEALEVQRQWREVDAQDKPR